MNVRPAEETDASAIEALYRLLVPLDDNIHVEPRRLAELRDDLANHLLVVEGTGGVCATAFLTVCPDPMYGFLPYGVVENVIVLPAAQGKGVGRALMTAVEDLARTARCTKLMLLSSLARVDAHAFFTHMGFNGDKKVGFVKYLNRTPRPVSR